MHLGWRLDVLMKTRGLRMMKILIQVVLILLLAPLCSHAADRDNAMVQELFSKSGLEKQLNNLPLSIQAAFDQAEQQDRYLRSLPKRVTEIIKTQARESFRPKNLKPIIFGELSSKLNSNDIRKVLAWLNTPLGKKCTRLEEAASTPEAYAAMQEYTDSLKKTPPTAERLDALKKFDSATRITETSIDSVMSMQVAVAFAITATLPKEQQMSLERIAAEIEKNRSEIEPDIAAQTLVSLLFTYKSLTEAELSEYTAFVSSPAGVKYHDVTSGALKKAIMNGSFAWGTAIGEALKEESKRSDT
jgi:hypothetical protein